MTWSEGDPLSPLSSRVLINPPFGSLALSGNARVIPWVCFLGTRDRNSDVIYLYSEHYLRQAQAFIPMSIKARGEWMQGVFRTLSAWRTEFRLHRRADKSQVVKENALLMDDTRHLVLAGMKHAASITIHSMRVQYVAARLEFEVLRRDPVSESCIEWPLISIGSAERGGAAGQLRNHCRQGLVARLLRGVIARQA